MEPFEQRFGAAAAAVGVAGQERFEALGAESAGVCGARVALEEGESDRGVDVGEDRRGAGPEAGELGAQAVGELDAGGDQVVARARQRLQRHRLIAGGREPGEAVVVGARELAEHEGVEAVGLAARRPEALPGGLDLVGMDRQHLDPGGQQAPD